MTVRLPSGLDPFTGGVRHLAVEPGRRGDLAGVIHALDAALPGLAGHLVDRHGHLRPHLLWLVDGAATRDLARPVDGEVRLLTAVSGG